MVHLNIYLCLSIFIVRVVMVVADRIWMAVYSSDSMVPGVIAVWAELTKPPLVSLNIVRAIFHIFIILFNVHYCIFLS